MPMSTLLVSWLKLIWHSKTNLKECRRQSQKSPKPLNLPRLEDNNENTAAQGRRVLAMLGYDAFRVAPTACEKLAEGWPSLCDQWTRSAGTHRRVRIPIPTNARAGIVVYL